VGAGAQRPVERADFCTAAQGGQLEVLSWAREHDCPWDYDTCAAPPSAGTWK